MKRLTTTLRVALVLALLGGGAAVAKQPKDPAPKPPKDPAQNFVPEFDATTAGAIAALVAGGALVIARRRRG